MDVALATKAAVVRRCGRARLPWDVIALSALRAGAGAALRGVVTGPHHGATDFANGRLDSTRADIMRCIRHTTKEQKGQCATQAQGMPVQCEDELPEETKNNIDKKKEIQQHPAQAHLRQGTWTALHHTHAVAEHTHKHTNTRTNADARNGDDASRANNNTRTQHNTRERTQQQIQH